MLFLSLSPPERGRWQESFLGITLHDPFLSTGSFTSRSLSQPRGWRFPAGSCRNIIFVYFKDKGFFFIFYQFSCIIIIPTTLQDPHHKRLLGWIKLLGTSSVINQSQQAFIALFTTAQERLSLKYTWLFWYHSITPKRAPTHIQLFWTTSPARSNWSLRVSSSSCYAD